MGSYDSTLKYVGANSDTKSPLRKVVLDNFIWAVGPDFHRPEEADWEVLGEFYYDLARAAIEEAENPKDKKYKKNFCRGEGNGRISVQDTINMRTEGQIVMIKRRKRGRFESHRLALQLGTKKKNTLIWSVPGLIGC